MRQRYRTLEDQKLWHGLALNHDLAKRRGLESKTKMSKMEDVLSKLE